MAILPINKHAFTGSKQTDINKYDGWRGGGTMHASERKTLAPDRRSALHSAPPGGCQAKRQSLCGPPNERAGSIGKAGAGEKKGQGIEAQRRKNLVVGRAHTPTPTAALSDTRHTTNDRRQASSPFARKGRRPLTLNAHGRTRIYRSLLKKKNSQTVVRNPMPGQVRYYHYPCMDNSAAD
jgi:hypothetical protein